MCLAERMWYYSFRYSTICYGVLVFLCAPYNVSNLNLQRHFNEFGTSFGVTHTLSFSIDGLVIAHHNKICDKLLYLSWSAFTSAYVHVEPLIHQGHTRSEQEIRQGSNKGK